MNLMPPQIDLFVCISVLSRDALIFRTISFNSFSYFPTTKRRVTAELNFFCVSHRNINETNQLK